MTKHGNRESSSHSSVFFGASGPRSSMPPWVAATFGLEVFALSRALPAVSLGSAASASVAAGWPATVSPVSFTSVLSFVPEASVGSEAFGVCTSGASASAAPSSFASEVPLLAVPFAWVSVSAGGASALSPVFSSFSFTLSPLSPLSSFTLRCACTDFIRPSPASRIAFSFFSFAFCASSYCFSSFWKRSFNSFSAAEISSSFSFILVFSSLSDKAMNSSNSFCCRSSHKSVRSGLQVGPRFAFANFSRAS
mmetsp:Transcript_21181/g.49290  ORF Transcript_21181/g.49290 Transcript_21181/m.49290 type:complete len:251 (-) Transcript_21181:341-1093(-)